MDLGLLYKALDQRQVSMVAGNATDGQLSVLDVLVLQDDKRYFPPYDCALAVRRESLDANPPLRQAITELTGLFTDRIMRKLNNQVDGAHRPVREVAEEFLRETACSANRRSEGFPQTSIRYRSIARRTGIPCDAQCKESLRRGICGRLPSRSFLLL